MTDVSTLFVASEIINCEYIAITQRSFLALMHHTGACVTLGEVQQDIGIWWPGIDTLADQQPPADRQTDKQRKVWWRPNQSYKLTAKANLLSLINACSQFYRHPSIMHVPFLSHSSQRQPVQVTHKSSHKCIVHLPHGVGGAFLQVMVVAASGGRSRLSVIQRQTGSDTDNQQQPAKPKTVFIQQQRTDGTIDTQFDHWF